MSHELQVLKYTQCLTSESVSLIIIYSNIIKFSKSWFKNISLNFYNLIYVKVKRLILSQGSNISCNNVKDWESSIFTVEKCVLFSNIFNPIIIDEF